MKSNKAKVTVSGRMYASSWQYKVYGDIRGGGFSGVDASNDAGVVKNGDFSVLSVSIDYILGSFRIKANINYLFPIGFPLTQNR